MEEWLDVTSAMMQPFDLNVTHAIGLLVQKKLHVETDSGVTKTQTVCSGKSGSDNFK